LAQIFPKSTNNIPLALGLAGPALGLLIVPLVWYYFSPWYTDVGYSPKQPIPYSHKLHVGDLGLDCRYCHASVEVAAEANIPPTSVCMNCHTTIKRDSPLLEPLRESTTTGQRLRWVRVHDLPDYAYFDHSIHVRAGVGCISCHGPVHEMEVVTQSTPLSMGWCLDCHRNPAPHLRPVDEVTNMNWVATRSQPEMAQAAILDKRIKPPSDCSGCHR
jgi:hypothetical protein